MAGKPERVPPGQQSPAPPSSQTQAPLQNVIVYVSENFPQTYMTQQNVECREAYSTHLNGSGYINPDPSTTSMKNGTQSLKHGKTQEFLSNGFLPVQNNGAYFPTNNNGDSDMGQNNTFSSCQMASSMLNNFAYANTGHTINNHGFDSTKCSPHVLDHHINLQQQNAICSANGTSSHMVIGNGDGMGVYTIAQPQQNAPITGIPTFTPNQIDPKQGHDTSNFDNYNMVMGDSNGNGVPRCDSVRSETAESSCSSLSSAECHPDNPVLIQQNQVQSQMDLNHQHDFQNAHNVTGFMPQSTSLSSRIFSNNGQQVMVNSSMGQQIVQQGPNQPYIPPGEHHIQIVQGNAPTGGSHPQFLQSGGSGIVVAGSDPTNCAATQMTPSNQGHSQLITTPGSNQLQLFPQNMNQIHVVASQVPGLQRGMMQGVKPVQQHLPTNMGGADRTLVPLQNHPHVVTTVANSAVNPVTTSVHQSVQFVTTVAGNQKVMSVGSNHCAVPSRGSDEAVMESGEVSVMKMQPNCSNPQVNQIQGPHVETVVVPSPGSLPPHSVLVPFGWKRLQNNGTVFYIR